MRSFVNNGFGTAGTGGAGGGGKGGQDCDTPESRVAEDGADGLGGGGGGGSTYEDCYRGGNGGSGVVILRYGAGGDGVGVVNPTISLTGLAYDDATGAATATYRVGWAGDGFDRADVAAVWGYREDALDHTNAVAASAIGQGGGSFALPRMSKTVYVRLLATNAGNHAGVSPEVKTLVLYNPAAPVGTVAVDSVTGSSASFTATVTTLGEGATEVTAAFQVCADRFFDEGTLQTFPATGTVSEVGGTISGDASGLRPQTTYYVRAMLANDVPADNDTDPVSFTTEKGGIATIISIW